MALLGFLTLTDPPASITAGEMNPAIGYPSSFGTAAGTITLPAFSNPNPIILPGGDPLDPGPGSIYPSVVQVSGLTNGVFKVTATVRNINHTWPDDIDLLLVGPQGQNVLLLSDCGLDNIATDVTITFDDAAAQSIPFGDPGLSSGTFRPTNEGALDDLPAPAPTRPFGTALSVFRNTNPNGTWALYAVDDQPENSGFITDGWSLTLTVGDPIADLALTQTGPTAPVFVGSNLTYTITVTNRGPAITTALMQDALPPSQAYVSATSTVGACTHNAGLVTCDLGNLLVGQGARITLVVSPIVGADSTNVASVAGNQLDPNPTNNAVGFVTSSIGFSDLAVKFSDAPAAALLAQPMLYSIIVTNNGSNPAPGVTVTNPLPPGFTLVAAVPSQGACSNEPTRMSCSLGTIGAGSAATVYVSARPSLLGTFTNFANAATTGLELVQTNNSAQLSIEVVPAADLAILARPPTTNVFAGQDVVSVFAITNHGPSATSAQFSDPLPMGLSFVSASTTHGSWTNTGLSVECNLGTILNGETATVTVVHRTLISGVVSNAATVIGVLGDPNPANNAALVTATISPSADLGLTVTDIPAPAWTGENLLYRMVITNRGASAASSVVLTNISPPNFTFVGVASTQGACVRSNNMVSCSLGTLAVGASAVVNLTVRPTATGLYTNLTSVMAAQMDPVPQNNLFLRDTRVVVNSGTFSSPVPVSILEVGPANPYPSTVLVSGLTGAVSFLRVVLTNLSHSYPDDLDLLLVGPSGQSVLFMSDVGGEFACNNTSLVFDDGALNFLPDSAQIISGLDRPSNYGSDPDSFVAPAPAGPYSTNLAIFRHTNPNGVWSLFIMDDATKDSGSLGGWSLIFSVTPTRLSISQSGSSVTLTFATEADASYQVEYKDNLNDANWTPLESVPGTGAAVTVTDTPTATPMRFYRVRLE